ncbi:hypothetical protein ABKN59_002826 [Abortiporus biennis]
MIESVSCRSYHHGQNAYINPLTSRSLQIPFLYRLEACSPFPFSSALFSSLLFLRFTKYWILCPTFITLSNRSL